MKHSKLFFFLLMLVGVMSTISFTSSKSLSEVNFYFPKELAKLPISTTLKIKAIRTNDPFKENLINCMKEFYSGVKAYKNFFLEDKKKLNQITVAEYIFIDTSAAEKAYRALYVYAENTRKLARADFGKMCYSLPEPQVYYASMEKSHVFLYTTYFNFMYKSGSESVETNIENNNAILIDDLYREITKANR